MRDYTKTEKNKKYRKKYYSRPEIKERARKYKIEYRKNPEVKLKRMAISKKYNARQEVKNRRKKYDLIYNQINKVKINQMKLIYMKNKIKNNKSYHIQLLIRRRLLHALTRYTKLGKITTADKYGINYKAIIEHLKPFPQNILKYHIDHIKPLCSFNLEDPNQIKEAFAPENHQWLLVEENLRKGGKLR